MPRVSIDEATTLILAGGLVGIPTETVYGLGANGLDPDALGRIFRAKGRPANHPLILHLLGDPDEHAEVSDRARVLVAEFWPGPLTLVLPKRAHVPGILTGGHPTVAMRSPAHPVARALLVATGLPLAAPSANPFGRTSPTTADHVLADFPELPVVDGGPCQFGVESTIVDLTGNEPALLRPGAVSRAAIEALIGPVQLGGTTPAPGNLATHYAPSAAVFPTSTPDADAARLIASGLQVMVLHAEAPGPYAAHLFARLRELDRPGVDVIVAEWCEPVGIGIAVNDRLARAGAGGVAGR